MRKRLIILSTILLCAIMLSTACTHKVPETEETSDPHGNETDIDSQGQITIGENETVVPREPISVDYTISYYDVIEDKMIDYSGTEVFEGEPQPEFFIEKLAELLKTSIVVNSVIIKDKGMTIDFSSDHAPLNGVGSYTESCILDSIANVLLDVFTEIDRIYYTEDGKEYESGHLTLPKDMPYAERKPDTLG